MELTEGLLDERARASARKSLNPDFAQCGKGELRTIGRASDGTYVLHPDRVVSMSALEINERAELLFDAGAERHPRHHAGVYIDPMERSAGAQEQTRPIGTESVSRHEVEHTGSLSVVPVDRIGEPAFFVGLEVAKHEASLCVQAHAVDHPSTVARDRGTEGAIR